MESQYCFTSIFRRSASLCTFCPCSSVPVVRNAVLPFTDSHREMASANDELYLQMKGRKR